MNTDPTTEQTPESELRQIATAIETWRADSRMTKKALLDRWPELGTDSTYGKIQAGKLHELNVSDKWLPQYRSVWDQITNDNVADRPELLLEYLEGPSEASNAYVETRRESGNARFILILGESGSGKTSIVKVMKSKPYNAALLDIEAVEIWRDRRGRGTGTALLRKIAEKLGLDDLPVQRDSLFNLVISKLQGTRRCLIVDEAHHLCPEGINTLKALINLSPVIIIALAMPGLWSRLASARHGWAECKQLTGNRLARCIYLGLNRTDVIALMQDRIQELGDANIAKASTALMADAPAYGNMKFVSAVIRRFQREVQDGQDATLETFMSAINLQKKSATPGMLK